ncbi:MAG TPA: sugar ABC transporter ATP-binding protein [Frankiaceae bacterium]|nr:sugar ABC transporter ATP-binding protein [Frankiaceae bacterium]
MGRPPVTPVPGTGPEVALLVERVSKTFPGTRALREVSLEVRRGHVHALVGGNGSGKSTLVGVLAGVLRGDPGGTLAVGGHRVASERTSPAWARAAGLHVVHQHPAVFPDLSVAENIAIGRGFPTGPAGAIRRGRLRRRTQTLLERFDVHARPDTPVAELRPADRTMVAIARALQDQEGLHEGVLVLDEPTAALPHTDVDLLLAALRRYADAGQAILLVSHRLDEVIRAADRATVLRDGAVAGTLEAAALSEDRLIELIVGRALERVFPEMPPVRGDEVALAVRGLAGGPLRDVSFALRRGEVLGVAGLLGSGRTELLKMIFGAYPVRAGEIRLDGEPVHFDGVGAAMRAGVAYVPEDRGGEAAFLPMSVRENVSAAQVGAYWRRARLRHRQEAADARRCIEDFLVRASSDRAPMSTLSGGNQQKVVLARWLRRRPRVLLLDEPTQGVDVAARAEIYALVRAAVAAGTSVLLVTDDFEELSRVSDRVVVLAWGRVVAEVRPPHLGAARLTELAFAGQGVAS